MVRVTTASQAAAADARAMAAGVPSWSLMQAAGTAAAAVIRERFADRLPAGVVVVAGAGNNGGDGYVVASTLAAAGVSVSVVSCGDPGTPDAIRARAEVPARVQVRPWTAAAGARQNAPLGAGLGAGSAAGVVVDALLGTGASGAPREIVADAIAAIHAASEAGARVISLDVPTGVDATTGATPGVFVAADLTVTFGTVKRGLLRNRDAIGALVAVDIGLGDAAEEPGAPTLVDGRAALRTVPVISANAHKGTRRRLLIVGGARGMAGAAVLAARGALRSGIGMVKVCVAPESVSPVQAAVPAALTAPWPASDAECDALLVWAHGVLVGPGIGLTAEARALVARTLAAWRGPVVVDADALTMFEGNAATLRGHLAGRGTVITPHVVEAARVSGLTEAAIDARRFDAASEIAAALGGTVLLKGVPTVVSDGHATRVVASGTPVLATGGSGDVLSGIVATLLTHTGDPLASAAAGAWVHGRAAEIAGAGGVRGVTLDDVVDALRGVWEVPPALPAGVLAELAAVGRAR